jgi:hypothetical protein
MQHVGNSTYQYSVDVARQNAAVLNENGPDGNIDFQYGPSLLSGSSPTHDRPFGAAGDMLYSSRLPATTPFGAGCTGRKARSSMRMSTCCSAHSTT